MQKKINLFLVLTICALLLHAQNKEEIQKINQLSNTLILSELHSKFTKKSAEDKIYALKMAKINNWPITKVENGNYMELIRVEQGKPLYYSTQNTGAAKSTRANFLHNNGGLGLNIEGQNMSAFVWDGGHALSNHQEFMMGGSSKIIAADTNALTDPTGQNHATHVTGTIIAKGTDASAKGMAPQANAYVFDWNNDLGEAASATSFGMLISNHSYGVSSPPDWSIGAYIAESANWDEIMFNAPFYLVVSSSGNNGSNSSNTNGDPNGGSAGFDKLYGLTTAKNTMIVANALDVAFVTAQGDIFGGNINSSSSQGPTDDFRIKPDITGNGTSVYSPIYSSTNSYDTYDGTSMASPNVAGSLLLLQQLYNEINNDFMLAATLKGLALHTADDKGNSGPDASYGWGYMDTKDAAEVIVSTQELIQETTLTDGNSFSFDVVASGSEPLKASISWIDKKGSINSSISNDHTPVLVNDLDIRITNGSNTYMPWKLTTVSTNTKDDNNVDPFERVDIDSPTAGATYTVTISHKGTLDSGLQNYSIVVTGITSSTASVNQKILSDFNIYPNPTNSGIINIALNNPSNGRLIVTNILGKKIDERILNNETIQQLNYSHLENGVYYITINNKNSITTKKLIIK